MSGRRTQAGWAGRLFGACAAAALLVGAAPARAGLFDDEEARKAILDLRSRVAQGDEASRQRDAELQQGQARLLEQIQQLRRSLVEMTTQLEAQRTEAAQLRGQQEQLMRDLAETQKRLRDAVVALDERLRALEPQRVTLDGREISVRPEERQQYEAALALLRQADYERATAALSAFVDRYPVSGYIDSARFWLGNAQYGLKMYKEALASFRTMLASAPQHPRAAEAMLAMANCQAEMKDVKAARRTIEGLLKAYPDSEAAVAAKERLAALKG